MISVPEMENKIKHYIIQVKGILPAIHAVRKHTMLAATKPRNATSVIFGRCVGAKVESEPINIPIEEKLENPHKAYVVIASVLFCIK